MSDNMPDMSEFNDWLANWPADSWPEPWEDTPLSAEQQKIVTRNAKLLLDRDAWSQKVEHFEHLLNEISDLDRQEKARSKFRIRFDTHRFTIITNIFDFSNFEFPCSVSFARAYFQNREITFFDSKFSHGNISFRDCQFGAGPLNFREVSFGAGDVSFADTKFGGEVRFDFATFGQGNVTFQSAEFGGGLTSFSDTEFRDGDLCFELATKSGGVFEMYGATFGQGEINFKEIDFSTERFRFAPRGPLHYHVSFQDAEIGGNFFVTGIFSGCVSFRRIKVARASDFSDCVFLEIPDFRDTKFDRPPEVARMDVLRPKMKGVWPFKWSSEQADVAKLRKLKSMALAANDHEMDGKFFAMEMMAKRGTETDGAKYLLDNFYWLLSRYGQSIARPLCSLVGSFFGFAAIYAGILRNTGSFEESVPFIFEYSFRNTLPLVNTLFRNAPSPNESYTHGFETRMVDAFSTVGSNADWIVNISILQQAIGAILLFLLLLGLRNRFRLK